MSEEKVQCDSCKEMKPKDEILPFDADFDAGSVLMDVKLKIKYKQNCNVCRTCVAKGVVACCNAIRVPVGLRESNG